MVRRRWCRASIAVVLLSQVAVAEGPSPERSAQPPASAAPPEPSEAERAFFDGLQKLREEKWVEAEVNFRRSLALVPRASTRYNLALVLFKQHRAKETLLMLDQLLDAPTAAEDAKYREYARALVPFVLAQLVSFELEVRPADATVRIDGHTEPGSGTLRTAKLEPGSHRVEVSRAGYVTKTLEFAALAGSAHQKSVNLARTESPVPAPSPPPPRADETPQRPPIHAVGPWVTIGVGAALLAAGTFTGIRALSADGDFKDECSALESCSTNLRDEQDDVRRQARLTNILLGSGAALVAGGVLWKYLTPTVRPATGRNGATEFGFVARTQF